MNINIKTIPHKSQLYETVGDWRWGGDDLNITVSDMGNWKYEMLVGIHEAIEALLCKDRNIEEKDVSDFDIEFEKNRQEGNNDEPGDDKNAPYRKEHFFATSIERLLAAELSVDWKEYGQYVISL